MRRLSSAPRSASWTRSLTPATSAVSSTWQGPHDVRRPGARMAMTSVMYSSPWALSVRSRLSAERSVGGVEGVDAGVDLADGALRRRSASACSTMPVDLAGRRRAGCGP